jgi:hypothetical protein
MAAASGKPSVIARSSIRSVSLPLRIVSIDALGNWKGILGWKGHLKGWPVPVISFFRPEGPAPPALPTLRRIFRRSMPTRAELIYRARLDRCRPAPWYRGNLIVHSLVFLGLWRSGRGGVAERDQLRMGVPFRSAKRRGTRDPCPSGQGYSWLLGTAGGFDPPDPR